MGLKKYEPTEFIVKKKITDKRKYSETGREYCYEKKKKLSVASPYLSNNHGYLTVDNRSHNVTSRVPTYIIISFHLV